MARKRRTKAEMEAARAKAEMEKQGDAWNKTDPQELPGDKQDEAGQAPASVEPQTGGDKETTEKRVEPGRAGETENPDGIGNTGAKADGPTQATQATQADNQKPAPPDGPKQATPADGQKPAIADGPKPATPAEYNINYYTPEESAFYGPALAALVASMDGVLRDLDGPARGDLNRVPKPVLLRALADYREWRNGGW